MLRPRNHNNNNNNNNRSTSPTPSTRTRSRDAIRSTHRGRNTFDTVAKDYRVVTTRRKAKLRDKDKDRDRDRDRVVGQIQVGSPLHLPPQEHIWRIARNERRMPSTGWRPSRNFGCFYRGRKS
jgi:hypothetical protein